MGRVPLPHHHAAAVRPQGTFLKPPVCYVNTPKSVVEGALDDAAVRRTPPGNAIQGSGLQRSAVESMFLGGGHNAPSLVHAQWYLDRMREWGHADDTVSCGPDLHSICMEGFYNSVTSSPSQTLKTPVVTGSVDIH
ncbi:MAG: hypothetical protein M3Y08_05655 [Fibrobacterota bacterium]|nr:hypothetical protein [Fibrobacterota bacterium]